MEERVDSTKLMQGATHPSVEGGGDATPEQLTSLKVDLVSEPLLSPLPSLQSSCQLWSGEGEVSTLSRS